MMTCPKSIAKSNWISKLNLFSKWAFGPKAYSDTAIYVGLRADTLHFVII